MRHLEELLTAKKWPYQQADIRPIPDDDTDQVQQRVKGQAVRGSVRSTCHQNICRLCNHMRWRCVWVLLRWKWWRPAYILFWGRFQTDVRKSGQQKTKQTWNVSQIQTAFWGDLKSWQSDYFHHYFRVSFVPHKSLRTSDPELQKCIRAAESVDWTGKLKTTCSWTGQHDCWRWWISISDAAMLPCCHVTSVGRHLHCYHSNTKIWPDRLQIIMQDSRWNKSDLSAVWTKLDR